MGFDKWAYQTQSKDVNDDPSPVLIHNFPKYWETYYVDNKCSHIDPVITMGSDVATPFQWSALTRGITLSDVQKEYYANATEAGLADGLAVPIRNPSGYVSMVSMASQENERELNQALQREVDQLIAISYAFHSMAKDLIELRRFKDRPKEVLTLRQKEVLLWVARGKTSWEASQILGISERTVISHVESAKERLGAANRFDAVVKAIMGGHINP